MFLFRKMCVLNIFRRFDTKETYQQSHAKDPEGKALDSMSRAILEEVPCAPRGSVEDGDCPLLDAVQQTKMKAKEARETAVKEILATSERTLTGIMTSFEKVAGGTMTGASWKSGLPQNASLEKVKKHASKTLNKQDGVAVLEEWKSLQKAAEEHNSLLNKFHAEEGERLEQARALVRLGRVTISEGILLEDLTNKPSVMRQVKELRKVGASAKDLQEKIFDAMELVLKGST